MRIILAAALAVILIAIIAAVVIFSGKDPYTVLYQDLTPTEVSEILTWFENNEISDYQVAGNVISVRNEQYASLLAKLAQAGYPKDGTLYGSYWDHAGTMSTTSERATAYLLSRQEALETSIRTFDGVLDATVYITPGEERTYVLEDVDTASTASVKLTLRSGYVLPDEMAEGIRRMVARAWSGLNIENIEIVDTIGNVYTDSATNANDAAELQSQLQESTSNKLRTQIKQILDPIYGAENVNVAVSAMVEVNRRVSQSTVYNQPEGSYDSAGLIGHELGYFAITRDGYEPVGGIPGTTTNSDSDIPNYMENMGQDVQPGDGVVSSYERDNKIDTTTEEIEYLAPRVVNVGIAVTINENANTAANVSVNDLRSHVAAAANISLEEYPNSVSVMLAPFPTPPAVDEPVETGFFTPERMPLLIIGAVAMLLIIIILVVILSLRRKKKRQEEEDQRIIEEQLSQMGSEGLLSELGIVPPAAGEEGEAPPPTSGADIMDINTERSMELRKAVRQFVQNNPEVAAMMLKSWLRGGDDDG